MGKHSGGVTDYEGVDMPKITTAASFWNYADKTGGCWLWTGPIDKHGYGRYRNTYAHRFAFELHAMKSIGQGRQIDHVCHVRHCVNPAHLRSVSNKQNQENRRGPNQNNTSGVLGVHWNKRHSMWCAQFKHNGRCIYVGMYKDLADAARAIKVKRNQLYTCNTAERRMTTVMAQVEPVPSYKRP